MALDGIVGGTSGAAVRAEIAEEIGGLRSTFLASLEPTNKVAGMMWIYNGSTPWQVRVYDGSQWVVVGNINPSTHLFTSVESSVPVGTIMWHAAATPPDGYLVANGAAYSRTTYASLFARIGTVVGAGDGSTTFNVPDLRGEFIRGWDAGRGVDPGRSFLSWQADAVKSHAHSSGASSSSINRYANSTTAGSGSTNGVVDNVSTGTGSYGGTETRPRNVALLPCIKY